MAKRQVVVEDIVSGALHGKTLSGVQWLPDSSGFTFTRRNPTTRKLEIYRRLVGEAKETLLFDTSALSWNAKPLEVSAFATTGLQSHLLLTGPQEPLWRHSYTAPYFLYNMETKALTPLAAGDSSLLNVALAPNNLLVAFVKGSNLYVARTDGQGDPVQLTHDGSPDILNGIFDWVYEEEFHRPDAFRWSPDSSKIAFWRTDQTRVKSFTLLDETKAYTEATSLKYPKVGEQNAIVKIGVVDVSSGQTVWVDIGANDDIYIPRMDWTAIPGLLAVQRLNRKQTQLELLLANVADGTSRVVMTEGYENYWVSVSDDFRFYKEQPRFLWTSEKSGFRHLYAADTDGKHERQVTHGDWAIEEIIGFDEKSETVYFSGKKDGAINHCFYRTDLLGNVTRISAASGWYRVNLSPDTKLYIGFFSSADQPEKVALFSTVDGAQLAMLESNDIPLLSQVELSYPEFLQFKAAGETFDAYMIKPADFDPAKKYPVLMYGYSGPETAMVMNRWLMTRFLWNSMMANLGCLIFVMDHRGIGGRGRRFAAFAYGDISKYAVADQLEGVAYLKTLPYVDGSRIGFWGWSGGGYLTCMLLSRSTAFKAGAAIAPLTDCRNYDTIWTERYMGLLAENKAGYHAADPLTYAAQLSGALLIVHGTGDDNVHPQNSIQYINALIAKNKQFELMLYPNRNHGLPGQDTQRHLWTMMTRFFRRHLEF